MAPDKLPAAGVLTAEDNALLDDIQHLYLTVAHAELAWVVLNQVAQAARDGRLHEVAMECGEAAEMRVKWLRTRVKEMAPQAYAT